MATAIGTTQELSGDARGLFGPRGVTATLTFLASLELAGAGPPPIGAHSVRSASSD